MDEWNRHCRSGRQCGSAIQGLDRIWVRYLTDWVYSAITVAVAVAKWEGYGKLFSRPYALPQVMVVDNQRPEHADSPIGMNQRCRNVTTMTD